MPQMPKRVKFRKNHRGVARGRTTQKKYNGGIRGFANRGNYVSYGDYGLQANVTNINQGVSIFGQKLVLWGVPADPVNDPQRYTSL